MAKIGLCGSACIKLVIENVRCDKLSIQQYEMFVFIDEKKNNMAEGLKNIPTDNNLSQLLNYATSSFL